MWELTDFFRDTKHDTQLQKIAQILERVDSALSKRRVGVKVIGGQDAAATNGSHIAIQVPSDINFLKVKAYNWHELGHVLFTDYTYKDWEEACRVQNVKTALGILEDIRVENLIVKRYGGSVSKYLTMLRMWRTLDTASHRRSIGWTLLVYGSKFIPLEIRRSIRKSYLMWAKTLGKNKYQEIVGRLKTAEDLVDRFLLEKDARSRIEIAKELSAVLPSKESIVYKRPAETEDMPAQKAPTPRIATLIEELNDQITSETTAHIETENETEPKAGQEETEVSGDIPDSLKDELNEPPESNEADKEPTESNETENLTGETESNIGEHEVEEENSDMPTAKEENSQDNETSGEQESEQKEIEQNDMTQPGFVNTNNTGNDSDIPKDEKQAIKEWDRTRKELNKALKNLENDKRIKLDIKDLTDKVEKTELVETARKEMTRNRPVTNDMRISAMQLSNVIRNIDMLSRVQRPSKSGLLNMKAVMKSQAAGKSDLRVFKRRTTFRGQGKFKVVLALDDSGSMEALGEINTELSKFGWELWKGFTNQGSQVSIVYFGRHAHKFEHTNDTYQSLTADSSDTQLSRIKQYCFEMFNQDNDPETGKLLMVLTDTMLGDIEETAQLFRELFKVGVAVWIGAITDDPKQTLEVFKKEFGDRINYDIISPSDRTIYQEMKRVVIKYLRSRVAQALG